MTARSFTVDLPVPRIALAVGAHPDDVEFGCGGTLAKWAAAGCAVHHLVCTDGAKGTWDPTTDTAALVLVRHDEQRAAAKALGATGTVTFLGAVDGELEASLTLRAAVAEVIRRVQPDVVLGHDPWKRYRLHPDHRAAGFLVCDAVVAARDPHFYPEQGLAPHRPSTLLLWEADEANHAEDVSASLDTKLAALEAHASQFESTMGAVDDAGLEAFRARVRARAAEHGARAGVPAAELFAAIRDI
ncbi:MAG TPA: PIG-L deacetylase family protein [Acidimicrobiales bacterium]